MKCRYIPLLAGPLLALLTLGPLPSQADDDEARLPRDDRPAVPDGMEVQARGPVHEAFAEPSGTPPTPGAIVNKEPPARIEEAPPEDKPEGDNVVFIPGYWSWDEEQKDFMWVSGFWRAAPAGRTWTPGDWQRVATGWQWTAGYWSTPAQQQETEYLPQPPETLDRGPVVPAPGDGFTYAPGIWVHQTNRFLWRPGYWIGHRPGWVWTPPRYCWTPAGCIFVNGFWDVPLFDRGLLCPPVVFTQPIFVQPAFVFRPVFVVQPDFLCGSLFVGVRTGCYHFGDYFGAGYRNSFVAWNSFRVNRTVVDVNFGYYRTAFAGHPNWERGLGALYDGRFGGQIARPPRTLVQQNQVINNITINNTKNVVVQKNVNITNIQNVTALSPMRRSARVQSTGLSSLAGLKATEAPKGVSREVKVVAVDKNQLKEEQASIQRMRAISKERKATEKNLLVKGTTPQKNTAPVRVKMDLPKGTPPPRVIKAETPPPPPTRPVADPKVVTPPKDKTTLPKDKDKVTVVPQPKDKTTTPPKDKVTVVPQPKEKTTPPKDKVTVVPQHKDKTTTPPKDKDKVIIVNPPKDKTTPPKTINPMPKEVSPPKTTVTPPKTVTPTNPPPMPKTVTPMPKTTVTPPPPPPMPKTTVTPPPPKTFTPPPPPPKTTVSPPPPMPKTVTSPPPMPKTFTPPPPPMPKTTFAPPPPMPKTFSPPPPPPPMPKTTFAPPPTPKTSTPPTSSGGGKSSTFPPPRP